MFKQFKEGGLAIAGGVLLAMMIDSNSQLARHTSSVFASWVAHGVGAAVALLLVGSVAWLAGKKGARPVRTPRAPLWSYLGGLPGAFTVILAALAVNGPLSLSGAIALMMVGQVLFGLVSDHFGWLGVPARRIRPTDLAVVACVLCGSGMIIFGGRI
ncbi:DMT family transporter [Paludibacterium paludis]|uniref:Membrane protein n=1 Tax=Paludibacterium paludis TaxID=1225769 RepID=A0A918P5W3_9NEIS|nr:DMT family transporter [Paludibacterium paludis]GGY23432.1 membrane protein [Paludibacterium paludis]